MANCWMLFRALNEGIIEMVKEMKWSTCTCIVRDEDCTCTCVFGQREA